MILSLLDDYSGRRPLDTLRDIELRSILDIPVELSSALASTQ